MRKRQTLVFLILLTGFGVKAQEFITQWTFPSAGSTITFNAQTAGGGVSYTWTSTSNPSGGSGSFTSAGAVSLPVTIAAGDVVILKMEPGNLQRFYMGTGNVSNLTDVVQWGAATWNSMEYAFEGCNNLNITASDIPDLSSVTSMAEMFYGCTSINGPTNIGSWNTAHVTNMRYLFFGASSFNQPIGSWNTANVTTMSNMFQGAAVFNQDIGSWDTGNVTLMGGMFSYTGAFNQNIGNWNTANVTAMYNMFASTTAFNQDISGWNTSNVTSMFGMFVSATAFNQDISGWNTSNVDDMWDMFYLAKAFNQNLGNWTLNPNVNMYRMLSKSGLDCTNYSATLNGWLANNPAVTGRGLMAHGLVYNSSALSAHNTLTTTQGWTITGDSYDASCSVLPVHFGSLAAIIKNGNLWVNWSTLSERHNDHFEIEASKDGIAFSKIGELNSLADGGNSDKELSYRFSKDASSVTGLFGISMLLLVAGFRSSRRMPNRIVLLVATAGMLAMCFTACVKKDVAAGVNKAFFIRIKQVDKDGSFSYSKVIRPVN